MKHTLDHYEIVNALLNDDYARWTRLGANALAQELEEYEESTGQELEFDIVAIRGEWNEDSAEELIRNYRQNPDDTIEDVIKFVDDNTFLIIVDNDPNTYLYQAF